MFTTEAWQEWFGTLEALEIRLWGADTVECNASTMQGYGTAIQNLDKDMLTPGRNIREFRFVASEHGPIGPTGTTNSSCPMPFSETSLPKLVELQLENIALGPTFLTLINHLGGTLRILTFHNVKAGAQRSFDDDDATVNWAEVWDHVRTTNISLVELAVSYSKVAPLTDAEWDGLHSEVRTPPPDEEDRIKRLREMLRREPDKFIWPYVSYGIEHGDHSPQASVNADRLETGDDWAAYDLLQKEVRERRKLN